MCEGFQQGPKDPFRLWNWKIQRPRGQQTLLRWGPASINIKYKFHIPIIDELLDELKKEIVFTKLNLHFGYHPIIMRQEEFLKITFRIHEGYCIF